MFSFCIIVLRVYYLLSTLFNVTAAEKHIIRYIYRYIRLLLIEQQSETTFVMSFVLSGHTTHMLYYEHRICVTSTCRCHFLNIESQRAS